MTAQTVTVRERCQTCAQPTDRDIVIPLLLSNLRAPGATDNERDAADVIEHLLVQRAGKASKE